MNRADSISILINLILIWIELELYGGTSGCTIAVQPNLTHKTEPLFAAGNGMHRNATPPIVSMSRLSCCFKQIPLCTLQVMKWMQKVVSIALFLTSSHLRLKASLIQCTYENNLIQICSRDARVYLGYGEDRFD